MKKLYDCVIYTDSNGNDLLGQKRYIWHFPNNTPKGDFWSVLVYDCSTRQMVCTDQSWPSVHAKSNNLIFNRDQSFDIFFGPQVPNLGEQNWIKTKRGIHWFAKFSIYGNISSGIVVKWSPEKIRENNSSGL